VVTICTTRFAFNISTFCPHHVFMCFVWISDQTAIIPLYNINWQVFIRVLTLYNQVVTICTASLTFNNSTFCPHSEFMCFVWTWEQTAIIPLHNINWQVFITEFNTLQPSGHCMYRQFNIQQIYVLPTQCIYVFCVDLRTNSDSFQRQIQLSNF